MRKTKKQKTATSAFAALFLAYILWGINKPVIKLGLETVPLPIYLSVTVMGAALLIAPFAIKHWKRLRTKDYIVLVTGSIISITVGNVALLMGLERVPAVNASLIGLFGPLILFILSVEFLKEHISFKTFIGILIAFAGAAVIVGKPWEATGTDANMAVGNFFIILSVLCEIVGTLIIKTVLNRVGMYQVTFIHLMVGILPVALFSLQYLYALSPSHAGPSGYIAIGFNIVAITFANCLFMYGLKYKKAQEVGIFSYLSPIATIAAAWLILSEVPGAKTVVGAALIFTGIYLAQIRPLRKTIKVVR